MKKIYAAIFAVLIILMIPAVASATTNEIDLSGLSFEELVELKDRINLAIWESKEWQEVEVPQGVWEVGEDIPAGKWTIKAVDESYTNITVGTELLNGGADVKYKTGQLITSPTYKRFDEASDVPEWTIELEEGQYVEISSGKAVFTPYSGKQSLGFK